MEDFAAEAVPLTEEDREIFDPLSSGFIWYTPPLASEASNSTGGHQWCIAGHDMQVLTMTVPTGETITTEVGTFMYMHPKMETKVELTLCSPAGCGEGCNRIWGGEGCAKLLLVNESGEEGYVGLTPNFPAKIIPIKFGTHVASGKSLIAKSGAYLSELGDVDVGCNLDFGITTCCFAGLGLCRQKLSGSDDSIAFLNAGGTIVYKLLKPDEVITVDSASVVAFEESVDLGIKWNGRLCGCCTCCCGGEGCCSTTLKGPGRVYMQSMSFSRFQAAVSQTIERDEANNSGTSQSSPVSLPSFLTQ
ncbi:mitochondrial biogenesis AIM24 [Nitzschia inconspicua]|uniref:Mitochondrial biogenesis AIM24 n=1 Tax=Nitzschia inconspicua TaxID=303405 RepID=A0A9K3PQ88_9STRA|nr:mitochondrial biogenesis AIM24 [Nitzschia inconspicua]